jgi:8-oxo-dGTP diphosphatase
VNDSPTTPKAHTSLPALRFVAAALIVRDREVLIGQRRPDQPMASLWEFPGG